ncbi:unnamed protein product [Auanema sp. JU1783]|nr:unnamed protein product [Auanema sp. JU1783]
MSELEALNGLCQQLYMATDQSVRLQAEQNLAELIESPECLRRCMLLLESGQIPYGPLVASTALMKLLNSKTGMTTEQKLDLSRYILNMLGSRSPSLPSYVVTSLCQLFARITKQEWNYSISEKTFPFREPVTAIMTTIDESNIPESLLAAQVLSLLVVDMNSNAGMESMHKHRKSMSQFRDGPLLEIFQISVKFLENVAGRVSLSSSIFPLVDAVLDLCLNTLLFDFVGSLADETSEETFNVQVPTVWRECFIDGKIVTLIFELYQKLPNTSTEKLLHITVQLASIRRTLFNAPERQSYLTKIVVGVKMVLENPSKLNDQGAFHEFSRLIARLKTNYQLMEMIKIDEYSMMMRLLAGFTVESLRLMEFSANSTYFLLTYWQRMVSSVPYVRNGDEHLLNVYCPEIFAAFVESRLQNVDRVVREGADDPLEDQGATIQILELLAGICRCEYEKTYRLLAQHFDENYRVLEANTQNPNFTNYRVAEGRLIWVITLIGTAVFSKTTFSTPVEEHDKLDGDLVQRCLKYMQINDQRLYPTSLDENPTNGNVRLEVSFIHVLENFRKSYIMEQVTRTTYVYQNLANVGVSDETEMLGVIVKKILTNIKLWPMNEDILDISLCLLKELSMGYTAVRKLFRLPDIQLLLNNHTAEHFAFLGPSITFSTMKSRTIFYEALTRLLAVDLNDDDQTFQQFMVPLTETVKGICSIMDGSSSGFNIEQLQKVIVGLFRDLRGIAIACTTKNQFQLLFDWMFPQVFEIMGKCVEEWTDNPDVSIPLFRLLCELLLNRQQRLKFEMNSCSAVLLFKECSKLVTSFGNRFLALASNIPKEQVYKKRLKTTSIIFQCLKHAMAGSYIPFGVFYLYGDSCLQNVLDMFMKLFLRIPEEDFLGYTKLAQSYYALLEIVVHDNMAFMSNLEPTTFASVLRSIQAGLLGLDTTVMTSACSALDNILNYLFKRITGTGPIVINVGSQPEGNQCIIAVEQHPQILAEILTGIMQSLMMCETRCQWSVSRPLLGLILLQEDVFQNFKREVIQRQATDRQRYFETLFNNLMEGIERNLTIKNKDLFTQNIQKFRRDLGEVSKGHEITSQSSNNNDMC